MFVRKNLRWEAESLAAYYLRLFSHPRPFQPDPDRMVKRGAEVGSEPEWLARLVQFAGISATSQRPRLVRP
jgi:hypothetical protein